MRTATCDRSWRAAVTPLLLGTVMAALLWLADNGEQAALGYVLAAMLATGASRRPGRS